METHTAPLRPPNAATSPAHDTWVEAPGTGVFVPAWPGRHDPYSWALVPAADPAWCYDPSFVRAVAFSLHPRVDASVDPVLLVGPAGVGKTQGVLQLAAVARAPVVVVQCHADLRAYDLLGLRTLREGSMVFSDGPVTRAFRHGWWLLLDELSAASPGVLQALHGVLAGARTLGLDSGEVVPRGAGFQVFATSNTMGSAAAQRHRFAGNHVVSDATASRFTVKLQPRAPDAAQVTSMLLRNAGGATDAPLRATAAQLAAWFVAVRERALEADGDLQYILTLRELLGCWRMARAPVVVRDGVRPRPLLEAVEATVLHAFRPEEGEVVLEMLRACVPDVGGAPR